MSEEIVVKDWVVTVYNRVVCFVRGRSNKEHLFMRSKRGKAYVHRCCNIRITEEKPRKPIYQAPSIVPRANTRSKVTSFLADSLR